MDAMVKLLSDTLLTKDGIKYTGDVLAGKKHIMLYFSANWNSKSRTVTSKLIQCYNDLKDLGVEIVFVSEDFDKLSFDACFAEHPWLALPYHKKDQRSYLIERFKDGRKLLTLLKFVLGNSQQYRYGLVHGVTEFTSKDINEKTEEECGHHKACCEHVKALNECALERTMDQHRCLQEAKSKVANNLKKAQNSSNPAIRDLEELGTASDFSVKQLGS